MAQIVLANPGSKVVIGFDQQVGEGPTRLDIEYGDVGRGDDAHDVSGQDGFVAFVEFG